MHFILFCLLSKTTLARYESVREPVFSLIIVPHCKNKIRIVQYSRAHTSHFSCMFTARFERGNAVGRQYHLPRQSSRVAKA
uniref:Uncharacterized protein n=1 Tax=Dechloromonas aromatica (strain RCB) TaxID=159087 RepID=Q47IY1_DECAR